ncbi:alanine--tRNA ligase, cytoplasmic-like [Liolophura sinensis]|uniref:alanine--tRNA ligase, cytoplasmic-like n=1 Tax=Liolophura sinensis TaxID=3198878 RepID=UPI003158ACED
MYLSNGWSWCQHRVWKQMLRGLSTRVNPASKEIRKMFLDFFMERHGHEYVHSSSVIPPKGQGTYFTNAGMNQFKPLFLGTADAMSEMSRYRRVVNSQKCIRVGGKHNNLDDVGKDFTHHTFFEMLGNWSFADYFKTEACAMALQLLTQVYHLHTDRLYVTYFGGNSLLSLPPDEECRQVWLSLGIPPERVLPFGMKDNFWDMGNTGPCGPCSEIHYDHIGNRNAASLVNTGSPDVVEIWNLVFMQFDRLADQTLKSLPRQHVDTGMGLERLCAVIQGTRSNYDTDLFSPLFDHIRQAGTAPGYHGNVGAADEKGIDSAYRIVADHARMFTVTIADGLLPGNEDLEHKLRHILHRCIHQALCILHLPHGFLSGLVDVVVDSLGEAYPEISKDVPKIKDVVNMTEDRYLSNLTQARKTLEKFLSSQKTGTDRLICGEEALGLYEGRYGPPISLEILTTLAEEKGLSVDMTTIELKLKEDRETSYRASNMSQSASSFHLDHHALQRLQEMGVPETEDSGKYDYKRMGDSYDFTTIRACVCALVHDGTFVDCVQSGEQCWVILDRTSFYAESGGQVSDQGEIITQTGRLLVTDVQKVKGYVLHIATVTSGQVQVGESSLCKLDQARREGCMRNHTATHLLNFALRETLGHDGIRQQGSLVTPQRLTFDFSYLGSIDSQQLTEIEVCVKKLIAERREVTKAEMTLAAAQSLPNLVKLENELYPSNVRVVAVGTIPGEVSGRAENSSVELCAGTHVDNTADLTEFCVIRLTSVSLGTKRMTAVTGRDAVQAVQTSHELEDVYKQLEECVLNGRNMEKWVQWEKQLNKGLSEELVQKTKRDELLDKLRRLGDKMSHQMNKDEKSRRIEDFVSLVDEHKDSPFLISDVTMEITIKQMMKTLHSSASYRKPTFLVVRSKNGENSELLVKHT